jgi:hypothetical protein
MPTVRIATSTQGFILGVAGAMVMHAAGARKAIDWHTSLAKLLYKCTLMHFCTSSPNPPMLVFVY